ncbi:MAG: hypothetical protein ABWX67_07690 [Allosphingosinicella sp.]
MDQTDSRLAHSPEPASDDAASPCNHRPGEDLLDFEPVALRYRTDGLTPDRQRAFVEALADTGIVLEAAARIGVSEQSINRVRRRSDARAFDRACEAAFIIGARRLRSVAFERAIEGTLKGHYYHGELISQERVFDNRLLTFLLGKTERFLEPPAETLAICGDWETHMDALEFGPPTSAEAVQAPEPGPEFDGREVWEDDDGIWWTEFPPPAGFRGEERGIYGENGFRRTLSAREQALVDGQIEEEDAEALAEDRARRDRFFGFAGDDISTPGEAEPSEPSETSEAGEDPGEGPVEYESMAPPSFRRKPESMSSAAGGYAGPCSWIPDQVRDDDHHPPTSKPPRPGILADEPPGALA